MVRRRKPTYTEKFFGRLTNDVQYKMNLINDDNGQPRKTERERDQNQKEDPSKIRTRYTLWWMMVIASLSWSPQTKTYASSWSRTEK